MGWKVLIPIFTLILLLLGIFCNAEVTDQSYVTKHTLSKELSGYDEEPVNITNSFLTTDLDVYSTLQFNNPVSDFSIKWIWYDPNGKMYRTMNKDIDIDSPYVPIKKSAHASMEIGSNYRVEKYPGEWRVDVFINDNKIDSQNFSISKAPISLSNNKPMNVSNARDFFANRKAEISSPDSKKVCSEKTCGNGKACCMTKDGPQCYDPNTQWCKWD
jgi:hypothetical protein